MNKYCMRMASSGVCFPSKFCISSIKNKKRRTEVYGELKRKKGKVYIFPSFKNISICHFQIKSNQNFYFSVYKHDVNILVRSTTICIFILGMHIEA